MNKLKVIIIGGGISSERKVSLLTGKSILDNLDTSKYEVEDIFIDKDGAWFRNGVSYPIEKILLGTDIVINALHGFYGEDGKIQQILDNFKIPYTGSDSIGSSVGMSKKLSKEIYKQNNIKTPYGQTFKINSFKSVDDLSLGIFKTFPMPVIIKPVCGGSSVGMSIAHNINSLKESIKKASEETDEILVEEVIHGKEATCGVIDNFRDKEIYSLLPVEIIPPDKNSFFDYECKYNGSSKEICPGNFSNDESLEIQSIAEKAHKALGLRHYSRSDFIISPKRGIYILETNTLPGMTSESLFPKSLEAVGSNLSEFLDHLINLAILKK